VGGMWLALIPTLVVGILGGSVLLPQELRHPCRILHRMPMCVSSTGYWLQSKNGEHGGKYWLMWTGMPVTMARSIATRCGPMW
jgi:hypothetical protein